ncbi:MAG: AbrB/MazE/SpoVT family DNA-binding domain-containing protein [Alphaproteobacteria bacterium]
MSEKLKLRKIGNSQGVVLPKEILDRHGLAEGDTLYVIDTAEGIKLTPNDPDFEAVLESNRDYMKRHRNALHELSKR